VLAICVVGARPNFMKMKPVLDALEARGFETLLVHTGQHYDAAMSGRFLEELGIRPPDYDLGVGSGSHADQTARVMTAFEPVVENVRPDVTVVVGDVNSTLACALAAAKCGVSVAHVEAGLRSRDWSMPEEINRVVVDRLSDHLFAPSEDGAVNLRAEGAAADRVHVVGNVMIDTLVANLERARARPLLHDLDLTVGGYGVVTLHRPAIVDDPAVLQPVLGALGRLAKDCLLVFPAHPRTLRSLQYLTVPAGVRVIEPLGYLDFLALEASARLVLTDSGGIQEETSVLGVACLTLRDNTERPITIELGTNRLVGRNPDRIVAEGRRALGETAVVRPIPLWDGRAAQRVVDVLVDVGPPTGPIPARRGSSGPIPGCQ